MLSDRAQTVLWSVVRQHISKAKPVSSAGVVEDCGLDISSATVRNEIMRLEQEGYIIRLHHAAGAVPSEKAYRYYVETLADVQLPPAEKLMIKHLFHQVEGELEQWLGLTVGLLAKGVHNVAVVTSPRPVACKLHHLELVSLQGPLALAVLILRGAKVKQKLISFDQTMPQEELTVIANKLNSAYHGLIASRISRKKVELTPHEKQAVDCLINMMKAEDELEYEDSYLDGLHFLLEQPEFSASQKAQAITQLVENRRLGKAIIPPKMSREGVSVVIGTENRDEAIKEYSVVLGRYGLPEEAEGTIGVVGPMRMPYGRAISTISYLSLVMSTLVADLYGREITTVDGGQ